MNNGSQSQPPQFFLFTDFGPESIYVGQMISVIKSIVPDGRTEILTSTVPRQDPVAASFLLKSTVPYLPDGSYVLCVVDPGVGTERPIVAIREEKKNLTLVGPDNGMFGFLKNHTTECRKLQNDDFWRDEVSNTFHGRDIMAPTLAHLSQKDDIEEVGPVHDQVKTLDKQEWMTSETDDSEIRGRIIYVDDFGNMITNIHRSDLTDLQEEQPEQTPEIKAGHVTLHRISTAYSDVPEGSTLAVIGSSGYLEISVNQGSAADTLNLQSGDPVTIRFS